MRSDVFSVVPKFSKVDMPLFEELRREDQELCETDGDENDSWDVRLNDEKSGMLKKSQSVGLSVGQLYVRSLIS